MVKWPWSKTKSVDTTRFQGTVLYTDNQKDYVCVIQLPNGKMVNAYSQTREQWICTHKDNVVFGRIEADGRYVIEGERK